MKQPGHTYGGFISVISEWGMTVQDPFLPSPCELLEHSAHPFVTPVHLQSQIAGHRAITSEKGPEPG
jgi:hypothetical protein